MLSSSLQQPSSGKPSVPPGQPRMPGTGKLHAPPHPPTKESMWRKRTCRWDSGLSGVVAVGKGIDFFFFLRPVLTKFYCFAEILTRFPEIL